ncbi:TetR/AcrR family transcriptional regulator [Streptomyces millisiae]|uniref:TetR/AcrR family transcriptional regulator n=1 Tax=Streptomyces millisiae TaxID=3075542 RepID=A0ABU2LJU2_9ACTN|nr:TetR/AcrR family transcriptional regulator [Streptomyces sp. DSM 44918]MDT0317857.1 TetR/AcrR family transcriptional regulator [Streptomyces sp. DSM 44918]
MSPAPMRKDAARNRQRIVDVGRQLVNDGAPLQLNDVARLAEVGVATVYRHFPTPEALMETLATPGLEALVARAERALTEDEPWQALADFLDTTLEAQLTDPAISIVRAAPHHVLPRTTELATTLDSLAGELLDRAHAAGTVRTVVTWDDLRPLMCGAAYAATVHADGQETRLASGRRYLSVMLHGLRR